MKKYLIKEICTATENNENFKGQTVAFYHGKGGQTEEAALFRNWFFNLYGYSTKAAAGKALKHIKESRNWFEETFNTWTHSFEIVESEV